MTRWILPLPLILLLTVPSPVQSQNQSWSRLEFLKVGQRIQVVDQRLRSETGKFQTVSDEEIRLLVGKNEIAFQRADVFRISLVGRGRGKQALMGLAFGAAAGAAALAPACIGGDGGWFDATPFQCGAVVGAVGAGVGAAWPISQTTSYQGARQTANPLP